MLRKSSVEWYDPYPRSRSRRFFQGLKRLTDGWPYWLTLTGGTALTFLVTWGLLRLLHSS